MTTDTKNVPKPHESLKNISIICFGSRGDFQPYLALTVALKDAGYNIRLLSNIAYKNFAEEWGIPFVSIVERDWEKVIKEDPNIQEGMATGNIQKLIDGFNVNAAIDAPDACSKFMNEVKENRPDIFVMGSMSDYYVHYAKHVFGIPFIMVGLSTFVFNKDRGLCGLPTLPEGGHYAILMGMCESMYDGWVHHENAMESMSCPRLSSVFTKAEFMSQYEDSINARGMEEIICQSSIFKRVLSGSDSPKLNYVGPSILSSECQKVKSGNFGGEVVQNEIEGFLGKDPEKVPIYCGWGSMICNSSEFMVEFVVKALQYSGQRAIVLGGWAGLSIELLEKATTDDDLVTYAKENILFVKAASHENLFHRVKCIVHHGGAGTTNAALRSGSPSIITPVLFDQFDHAYLLNELGIGVGFPDKQLQKITAEELGDAIKTVVEDTEMKTRAMEVREQILQEDGSKAAISVIERYWESLSV